MRPRVRIENRARGGLWWRIPCALLAWLALVAPLAAGAGVWLTIHRAAADLPRVPDLDRWERTVPRSSTIVAADGTLLARLPFRDGEVVGHRSPIAYENLPDVVVDAFVAAEDQRFFEHRGVDPQAVARAARANYRAGRIVQGASTITQQVARNLLPEKIGRARTLDRKIREALLARRIEQAYAKERILEVYINHVFLGARAYGVAAAARAYFDKEVGELLPAEAALIAGLAQAPSLADPFVDPDRARARRDEVLRRMREAGFLSEREHRRARDAPLELSPPRPRYGVVAPWHTEHARRFVRRELPRAYDRGGLRIETTAEPALAAAGQRLARAHVDRIAGAEGPPELAAVLWDHRTDYVELSLGGRDFGDSHFDRVNQACRQPGSAFKPIVYAAALEVGAITPGTQLRDGPIAEYDENLGAFWKPDTAGRDFRGAALAQDALALSLNAPAVEVFDLAGADRVVGMARRLGIGTELERVRPLALGASCVVPIELAEAFAVFARRGRGGDPIYVKRITRGADVLVDRTSPYDLYAPPARRLERFVAVAGAERERVLDELTSFLLADMLASVVERGTGTAARRLDRPAAGKTGTTNDNVDAWFVGFTGRLTAAVWIGHDDPSVPLGRGHTGSKAGLPLWTRLIAEAEADRPALPVPGPAPDQLVSARVDRETGLRAPPGAGGALELFFVPGTEPSARPWGTDAVPGDLEDLSREF